MDTAWREGNPTPRVCLNPEITALSDRLVAFTEGCLSIPDVPARVLRPAEITLRWYDLDGAQHEEALTGFDAVCAQHEFDHLNGRLAIDLMGEVARAQAAEVLMARDALA
jgi:peptide deformylase